jgi:lipopolysaccharide transport system ATP-binding protein
VGTGFNDQLTGRENVFLNAALHGLTKDEISARLSDIVSFAEIERFIDTPVKHYSSGMRMRLAFSVAAHLDPDILIMDEVLAVGDLAFQRKCLERVEDLTAGQRTLLFVSHSMDAIVRYCDRCIWLDGGKLRMDGPSEEVSSAYVEAVLGVQASISITPQSSANEPFVASQTAQNKASVHAIEEADAPAAYLERAEIIDEDGNPTNLAPLNRKIGIRFSYRVVKEELVVPGIGLFCPQGTLVFRAVPPTRDTNEYRLKPGMYSATAWIPKNLLNVGIYSASVSTFNPERTPYKRHFMFEQALSFHSTDPVNADESSLGVTARPFPGPLRPWLEWEHSKLEPGAAK